MLFELIHLKGIVLPIALINEIRKPVHRGTIRYTQLLKFDNSSCSLTGIVCLIGSVMVWVGSIRERDIYIP
jgi:hypothetical protein